MLRTVTRIPLAFLFLFTGFLLIPDQALATYPNGEPDQIPPPNESLVLRKIISNRKLSPKSIVHSGTGRFFAQNMMYNHSISVYDRNYNLVRTISDKVNMSDYRVDGYYGIKEGAPVEAAFSHSGQYAWISNYRMYGKGFDNPGTDNCAIKKNYDRGFLYRINTMSLKIESVIEVGCVPKYVAVSPDNRLVLVTNWCSGDVSVVDVEMQKEVKRVDIGKYPRGIVIDSKARYAYISVMGEDKIAVLKLSDYSLSWIDDIGDTPRHLCLGVNDRYLYVSLDREGAVKKLDLINGEVVKTTPTGQSPRSMVMSDGGRFLYVVNYASNSLTKLETATMKEVQTIDTYGKPIGVTFDPETRTVWVACYSGTIMVFEDTEYQP
ncbi:MAG: YncE family protein, partial [Bacteroidota bacterium]